MDLKASATLRCVYPTKLYDRYGHAKRLFMQAIKFLPQGSNDVC